MTEIHPSLTSIPPGSGCKADRSTPWVDLSADHGRIVTLSKEQLMRQGNIYRLPGVKNEVRLDSVKQGPMNPYCRNFVRDGMQSVCGIVGNFRLLLGGQRRPHLNLMLLFSELRVVVTRSVCPINEVHRLPLYKRQLMRDDSVGVVNAINN